MLPCSHSPMLPVILSLIPPVNPCRSRWWSRRRKEWKEWRTPTLPKEPCQASSGSPKKRGPRSKQPTQTSRWAFPALVLPINTEHPQATPNNPKQPQITSNQTHWNHMDVSINLGADNFSGGHKRNTLYQCKWYTNTHNLPIKLISSWISSLYYWRELTHRTALRFPLQLHSKTPPNTP